MEPTENNTPESQPDGSQLNPPDASGTVPPVATPETVKTVTDAMSLAELNTLTGKTFPTKEAALKSIKDTYSYVGKKKDDVRAEVMAEISTTNTTQDLAKQIADLNKERFFDKNPQYADPAIRTIIDKIGGSPSEVVNSSEFKEIFTKISGYNDTQKLKTVLESNPRIVTSRDNLSKAREIQESVFKTGQYSGAGREQVEKLAVDSVKAVMGL